MPDARPILARAASIVTAALLAAAAPAASGTPVTLDARSLQRVPGTVVMDTSNATTIQFCRPVRLIVYKAAWLHAQISAQDQRIVMADAASPGETSASAWLAGLDLPLQIDFRASNATAPTHLYFVSCPPEQAAQQPPQRAPSGQGAPAAPQAAAQAAPQKPEPKGQAAPAPSAADWDSFARSLSDRQFALLQTLVARRDPASYAAFVATLTPEQLQAWARLAPSAGLAPSQPQGAAHPSPEAGSAGQPAALPAPEWLVWEASSAQGDGSIIVAYTLRSSGQSAVVLDSARLRVLDASGAPVQGVVVSRDDTSGMAGRLDPGGIEVGSIRIPSGAGSGPYRVVWPAVEIGSGATYLLEEPVPPPR
jgi:hypothetical protein